MTAEFRGRDQQLGATSCPIQVSLYTIDPQASIAPTAYKRLLGDLPPEKLLFGRAIPQPAGALCLQSN